MSYLQLMGKLMGQSERGVTAIGAVVGITVVAVMGVAAATLYQKESETSAALEKKLRSWAEQDAGVERTLSDLADDSDWSDTPANLFTGAPLEAGTYDTKTSTQMVDSLTLTSIGYMGNSKTTRTYTVTGTSVDTCTFKTDYNPTISCGNSTIVVTSQAALDAFLIDYGLTSPPVGNYKNLTINFAITSPLDITIHVPCKLNVVTNNAMTAVRHICLDGRYGIFGGGGIQLIAGGTITTISQYGEVRFSQTFSIAGDTLKAKANEAVSFGGVGSVGTIDIAKGTQLKSTGTTANSHAIIDYGVKITSGSLEMEADKSSKVNTGAKVNTSGSMSLKSNGSSNKTESTIGPEADVVIGGDLTMDSGYAAIQDSNSSTTVTGNFHKNATANCKTAQTAKTTAGSTSGNCF